MKIFEEEIWLASKSPRRLQLLKESGFQVKVVSIHVKEEWDEDMPYSKVAAYLAKLKGEVALKKYGQEHLLLTADSIVIAENKILEKPADKKEAHQMLSLLSGQTHEVHTGFFIQYNGRALKKSVCSKVHMDEITEEEREYYIDVFKPYDKAGSYGIQEWLGHCKIKKIEGSYTNIMGLPMQDVYRVLQSILG